MVELAIPSDEDKLIATLLAVPCIVSKVVLKRFAVSSAFDAASADSLITLVRVLNTFDTAHTTACADTKDLTRLAILSLIGVLLAFLISFSRVTIRLANS